jgi:hypothetical protein
MAGPDEREPPLHKGVIFLEVSQEGYFRASGYTGSKEGGDQDQILNVNSGNPFRVRDAAKTIVEDIVAELVKVWELADAPGEERMPPGKKPVKGGKRGGK